MSFEALNENMARCMHGESPPCTQACPFKLDIRAFAEKMQRGRFDSAYRQYRDAVTFPAIVARLCDAACKQACLRDELDMPVEIRLLELACVEHARSTSPHAFNVPAKDGRIAIVGAGLSGLTLALRLARKKYSVTIFEQSHVPGGRLRHHLPESIYLAEIEAQFAKEKVEWRYGTKITDLAPLGFDAYYLSAGVDLNQEGHNIFRCPPEAGFIEEIIDGTRAVNSVEWLLKTGEHNEQSEEIRSESRICLDLSNQPSISAVIPTNGLSYTADEAIAEAKRCLRCDCSACMQNCELLQKYQVFPKRLVENVEATLNPVSLFTGRVSTRMIASCNQCGLCKEVCPNHVDIGSYLTHSRAQMHQSGALPAVFHDFWLKDMAHANGQEAEYSLVPGDNPPWVFFPGCQLGASDPNYVLRSYAYLRELIPNTAIMLRCCGGPAFWAGDVQRYHKEAETIMSDWEAMGRPIMVMACPTCQNMMAEQLPQIPTIMIYEIMKEHHVDAVRMPAEREYCVFDPCASRNSPELQQCVRDLAHQCGAILSQELRHSRDMVQCCSWGGQIYPADPELVNTIIQARTSQSDLPYITYCSNCRDIFAASGKVAVHILDLIWGLCDNKALMRKPPTLTQRWINRTNLKRMLTAQYGGLKTPAPEITPMTLYISEELAEQMSRELIMEDDVRAVVEHGEQTGEKVYDQNNDYYISHLKRGVVTYWVTYRPYEDGYSILNVYSHRMAIEGISHT